MFKIGVLIVTLCLGYIRSDLVRLEIVNDRKTDSAYQVCGLYRSYNQPKNLKYAFALDYIKNYDPCIRTNESAYLDFSAIILTTEKLSNCSYSEAFSYIEYNLAGLAIINSNGPFVSLIFQFIFMYFNNFNLRYWALI